MSDIEIEIDGKKLSAEPNQMVIQVADAAGIYIPRFCYHKHLSVAANCRMCLVEVEKAPKTLPACATPVMSGMKVFTKSAKAIAAQKAVMEFLLINHPLDCPICDQGGECELQDLAMGFGSGTSYYREGKRSVQDQDLGPLIETEMTRCIQCTRCVRFGDEIAGLRELGMVGRGEHSEISTYLEKSMQSELSGNVIDICPVGALTSKPFRFSARAWELDQYSSVSPHDCVGSNLYIHSRYDKVMRVVPRENANINQVWIADRDRFSYQGLYHQDRLAEPMIRTADGWQQADWQTALQYAVKKMQDILTQSGPEQLGALASPNATIEELYLLQKLWRQLGSHNIDHRLRQQDFHDQHEMPLFPGLPHSIADLEFCDTIFLVGSHIQKEQPIAGLRVRQAAQRGATVMAVNLLDYRFSFALQQKQIVAPQEMVMTLARIAKALFATTTETLPPAWTYYVSEVTPTAVDVAFAKTLCAGKKAIILLGALAMNHQQSSDIRTLAHMLARVSGATVGFLTEGANAAGAWQVGAVPHRTVAGVPVSQPGLSAADMLKNPRQAYLLLNIEPEFDFANPSLAKKALAKADCVVALSLFKNSLLEQYADVILPMTPFTETAGTFVNAAGDWQSFTGVVQPLAKARPAWKVLRVLGNLFHLEGFDYDSAAAVCHEAQRAVQSLTVSVADIGVRQEKYQITQAAKAIYRIGEIPLYATDSLVRRAEALQLTQSVIEGDTAAVRMNAELAAILSVTDGMAVQVTQQESVATLTVMIDERVPTHAVWIAGGIEATKELGDLLGEVTITHHRVREATT